MFTIYLLLWQPALGSEDTAFEMRDRIPPEVLIRLHALSKKNVILPVYRHGIIRSELLRLLIPPQ